MQRENVLIVGEDEGAVQCVSRMGFRPVLLHGLQDAPTTLRRVSPAFVLVNILKGEFHPRILQQLSRVQVPIIVVTDSSTPARNLADNNQTIHVLSRPLNQQAFRTVDETALPALRPKGPFGQEYLATYAPLFELSAKMRTIKTIIEQVADTGTTAFIRGESGVGKDILARAIHSASPRRDHPFVKVNCAALPADLLESELFGHEKGAFTGAYRRKPGKFEFARSGTIFLDEIGELPVGLQAKLLHVLQDQEFCRVGGREMIRADSRVIASTNRDLEVALRQGQFREDLYYRLNVVEIHVPPLRERKEEIPFITRYFLDKFQEEYRRTVKLQPDTIALFGEYSWPGNIRELENMVRRLVVLGSTQQIHQEILARLRPPQGKQSQEQAGSHEHVPSRPDLSMGLREIARRAALEAERIAIREILDRVHWNRAQAARLLKISYKTLLFKIAACGLDTKRTLIPAESRRSDPPIAVTHT